ncbi:MAG TPA: hypothetical protein VF846_12050 [Thermoanaerobaculia bacterium]
MAVVESIFQKTEFFMNQSRICAAWMVRVRRAVLLLSLLVGVAATLAAETPNLLTAPPAANADASMTARIDARAISVDGVSRRAEVLLFGVEHAAGEYGGVIQRWHRLASDADGDGRVTFAFDSDVHSRSLWTVVDLHTGGYIVVTPEGFAVPEVRSPAGLRRGANPDEVTAVELTGTAAYVIVVRPAVGAWRMDVDQNGTNDDDAENGRIMRLDPARLVALAGNAPAPRVLTPGDLFLALDPFELELVSARTTR